MKRILLALAASTLMTGAALSQDNTSGAQASPVPLNQNSDDNIATPNSMKSSSDATTAPTTEMGSNPVPGNQSGDDMLPADPKGASSSSDAVETPKTPNRDTAVPSSEANDDQLSAPSTPTTQQ